LHGEALFKFVGNVRLYFIVFNIMITDKWLVLNVYIENQINLHSKIIVFMWYKFNSLLFIIS